MNSAPEIMPNGSAKACEATKFSQCSSNGMSEPDSPKASSVELDKISNMSTCDLVQQSCQNCSQKCCNTCRKVKSINFSGHSLSSLPDELMVSSQLSTYDSVTSLLLDYNDISVLPEGVFCNLPNLQVISLIGNSLSELPGSITQLVELRELKLNENQLCYLPEGLKLLRKLEILEASANELSHLPNEIGRMTCLRSLVVYENYIPTLPASFGLMRSLEVLELNNNLLTTLPPNFKFLHNLRTLNLSHNKLVTVDGISTLAELNVIDLSHNELKSLPVQLNSASKIRRLFANNNLLAHVPDWISCLSAVQELNLESNSILETPFLEHFGTSCSKLRVLHIGGNFIRTLPETLGSLEYLERFHIGSMIGELERRNFQNGNWIYRLPENFSCLRNLKHANLNENQIGYLPQDFGNLVNLEWLDLGQNLLEDLPDSFGKLSNLKFCQLSKNRLVSLPESFGSLPSLEDLRLDGNRLLSLPESFRFLTQLKTLDLFMNELTEMPEYFANFVKLTRLDMGENKFTVPGLEEEVCILKDKTYAKRDPSLKSNWRGRNRNSEMKPFMSADGNTEQKVSNLSEVCEDSKWVQEQGQRVDSQQQAGNSPQQPMEEQFDERQVEGAGVADQILRALRGGSSMWRTHAGTGDRLTDEYSSSSIKSAESRNESGDPSKAESSVNTEKNSTGVTDSRPQLCEVIGSDSGNCSSASEATDLSSPYSSSATTDSIDVTTAAGTVSADVIDEVPSDVRRDGNDIEVTGELNNLNSLGAEEELQENVWSRFRTEEGCPGSDVECSESEEGCSSVEAGDDVCEWDVGKVDDEGEGHDDEWGGKEEEDWSGVSSQVVTNACRQYEEENWDNDISVGNTCSGGGKGTETDSAKFYFLPAVIHATSALKVRNLPQPTDWTQRLNRQSQFEDAD